MPFADDGGGVTGILETLRHQKLVRVEAVGRGAGNNDRLQAVAPGVTTSHQARARGRTHGLRVELGELRAALGERVKIRRLAVGGAVEADVLPAEIIGDAGEDVGFYVGGEGCSDCTETR